MNFSPLRVGLIGCGNISGEYMQTLAQARAWLYVSACADQATGRAQERCLAIGIGIGSGYLFPTTFKREVVSDYRCPRSFRSGVAGRV